MTTQAVSSSVPSTASGSVSAFPRQVLPAPRVPEGAQPAVATPSAAWGPRATSALSWLATVPTLVALDVLLMTAVVAALEVPAPEAAGLLLGTILLLAIARLYRVRLTSSVLDLLPALVGRPLAAGAAVVAVDVVVGRSPGVEILWASVAFAGLAILQRLGAYSLIARMRRSGTLARRTLVVGDGELAGRLVDVLLDHPEYGLQPVGVVDDNPWPDRSGLPVPHLRGESELARLVDEHCVHAVVVAFGSAHESSVVEALRSCGRHPCEVYVVPRLYELRGPGAGADVETVWGIPLVRLPRAPFRAGSWQAKRAMDIALSATATALLSPLLLLCALLVRLESGPGVLFRQERIGLDGKPFVLLKFRSLRPRSDEESAQLWSVGDDDRIGPVGRLLRRTSLDELPQLWNILRGDMSLVGPRPERPHFALEFAARFPHYGARHRVPVGLTGWSQVAGLRGDTSIAERARFDNYYIENWSLWLDVKIMLRTVGQVVRCAGR